jgi:hypothetical protein
VRRITVLALFLAAVLAGCGGGGEKTTTTRVDTQLQPGPEPASDYAEQADAICRNHQSRQADLESQASDLGPITSEDTAHRIADLLREESANRRAEIGELSDLEPPAADVAAVNEFLKRIHTEATVIDTWAAAYDDGDEAAIRRNQIRLGVTAGEAADRARALGLQVCGRQ